MDPDKKVKELRDNLEPEEKDLVRQVLQAKKPEVRDKAYGEYVKKVTPKRSHVGNFCKAYFVGGLICVLGQLLINSFKGFGLTKEDAAAFATLSLILLSAMLTGMNWYQKIAGFAGAGTVVPITGFANSIASSAIEFKKEGWVFGVGCKIFTIAGPVILYGILCSWLLGVLYWLVVYVF